MTSSATIIYILSIYAQTYSYLSAKDTNENIYYLHCLTIIQPSRVSMYYIFQHRICTLELLLVFIQPFCYINLLHNFISKPHAS